MPDERRERGTGYRWIASEANLGKSPLRGFGGEYDVANHGEFGASAEAMAVNGSDGHFLCGDQGADRGVKLYKHLFDFVGRVCRDVDSCGKGFTGPGQDDCGNVRSRFDLRKRSGELFHHPDVDDVQRRILERDAGDGRIKLDFESRSWLR